MSTSGTYRDFDTLMAQYSPPSRDTPCRLMTPRGSTADGMTPPLRSPPRVPEVHVHPPGGELTPLPDTSQIPSLTARVPFYHVPGPCADNRRNLRLAAPSHLPSHVHQVSDGVLHPARLSKRAPGLLCFPCRGSAVTWTLRLHPDSGHRSRDVRARCIVAFLLIVTLLLATAALLFLLATVLGSGPISEWKHQQDVEQILQEINESSDDKLTAIHGEFVLRRERFTSDLTDHRSKRFRSLNTQIDHQLDELFSASEIRTEYNSSSVTSFERLSEGAVGVVVRSRLLMTISLTSDGEPANRVGLAFLRGLKHHEGRMWLGPFEVDVQTISFSGVRLSPETEVTVGSDLEVAGWASWGPWSECGTGGVRSRSRQCALQHGKGENLATSERCLLRGSGDLEVEGCNSTEVNTRQLPALIAVRDLAQNIVSVTTKTVRLCDDCAPEEVCVALLGEDVPSCRLPKDRGDPTGCGGLCKINFELCHQLDSDAFRCMDDSRCLESEWKCGNQLCIPQIKRCDGHMNCYDRTDEQNCGCNLLTHFHCGNRTSCLPLKKRCDGIVDCWDATDEINCTAACPSSAHFTCSNGQCIPHSKFCDGFADCKDKSDEPFGCGGDCKSSEYRCRNGRCIRRHTVCDTFNTCGDGSDEEDCNKLPEKIAIAKSAAKERALLLGTKCRDGQFRCANGDCILHSLSCDGVDDCGDLSDERFCPPGL